VAHLNWSDEPIVRRVVRWANNVARGRKDLRQMFTSASFVEAGTVRPPGSGK